jgi:hypothetical protein
MTNKEKTIMACHETIYKYRHPWEFAPDDFFNTFTCSLCKLFRNVDYKCKGCPLADKDGKMGCVNFVTYKSALRYFNRRKSSKVEKNEHFENRAQFYEMLIGIIEKLPEERFTRNGWQYFKFDYYL